MTQGRPPSPTVPAADVHAPCVPRHEHPHAFGQERRRCGEGRTRIVIALTAATMAVEIAAGLATGSMALLADGLHMASHAVALAVVAVAYAYARRHAHDARFSFGTGKVNALGGYSGAVLLVGFAAYMAVESVERMLAPVAILFDQAILVAVLGLAVNAASALLLGAGHDHGAHEHGPGDGGPHDHPHDPAHGHDHDHGHDHAPHHDLDHAHDHNLRAAYLHVLADALTSVAAIVALVTGKWLGWTWMDPLMGILGALLVARWSVGLLRQSARVLLDRQAPAELLERVRQALEDGRSDRVADLHVWSIGPGIHAASLTVLATEPEAPDRYRARLPAELGLVHVTIVVRPCPHPPPA